MPALRVLRLSVLVLIFVAAPALGQGLPSSSIAGNVTNAGDGQPLPGVTVAVRSPALQGTRQTVSAVNGDFIFPNLPPGEYAAEFQLRGFQTVTRTGIPVGTSQRQVLYVSMNVEAASASVVVTAETEQVSMTPQSSTTLPSRLLTQLPIPRTIESAVLLAPDVYARPGNSYVSQATNAFSIAGGETYENSINVDGISPQEPYFRLPEPLYIEDAVTEVATLTSGISAEYGRFAGGTVNVLTKTGGNAWSGSFRTTLVNDAWSARTPFGEELAQNVTPVYEATLGVPIWKDRIWLFGAGRLFDQTSTLTTAPPTNLSFPEKVTQDRYQLKLTASPSQSHTITMGYTHFSHDDDSTYFPAFPILDLSSTYDATRREYLILVNYTGTLSTSVFLEANYGQRRERDLAGSKETDLLKGTNITIPAPYSFYNAPIFCAVCPSPENTENTDQGVLKATFFASTKSLGSHTVVAGAEVYKSSWSFNNWQSGSGYQVDGTDVIYDHGDLYPVFGPGTVLWYYPIPVPAALNDIRTYSAYVNDTWRLSDRLTFNVGFRWDKNDARDPADVSLSSDENLSPRLAVTWDPTGKGALRITGSYGRYVSSISENQIAWAQAWGTPAVFGYFYDGPAINMDPGQALVSRSDALKQVFQWFGITAPGRYPRAGTDPFYVSVPGVSLQMRGDLKSQRADELTLGVNGSLGNKGSFRVDGIYRKYGNFYAVDLDTTTGTSRDPFGNEYDLGILRNTNEPLERHHVALKTSIQFQPSQVFFLGGSWTWSHTWGNQISESVNAGPNPPYDLTYPEYWQATWHIPVGDLRQDSRHRIRLWANWNMTFVPASLGRFNLSPLFAFDTGLPYGASGRVFVGDYVTNPDYVLPPSYLTYWFTGRDAYRTGTVTHLDLALNWRLNVGPVELFVQPQVLNVFNNHTITQNEPGFIDQAVRTAVNTPGLQPFNPFTSRPVEGVNYALSPTFGQALSPAAYQQPRTFRVSMGVRF